MYSQWIAVFASIWGQYRNLLLVRGPISGKKPLNRLRNGLVDILNIEAVPGEGQQVDQMCHGSLFPVLSLAQRYNLAYMNNPYMYTHVLSALFLSPHGNGTLRFCSADFLKIISFKWGALFPQWSSFCDQDSSSIIISMPRLFFRLSPRSIMWRKSFVPMLYNIFHANSWGT